MIKNYNDSLQAIYNHVGFKEDWRIYPISDDTKYYWQIVDNDEIHMDEEAITENREAMYSSVIFEDRFYDKSIYRGENYTLVIYDTQTDGMKYFGIFDNKKEKV